MKISLHVIEYLWNWKGIGVRKLNLLGIFNMRTKVPLFG